VGFFGAGLGVAAAATLFVVWLTVLVADFTPEVATETVFGDRPPDAAAAAGAGGALTAAGWACGPAAWFPSADMTVGDPVCVPGSTWPMPLRIVCWFAHVVLKPLWTSLSICVSPAWSCCWPVPRFVRSCRMVESFGSLNVSPPPPPPPPVSAPLLPSWAAY